MANRVTSDEVKAIIATSLVDISPFITAANLIVTKELVDTAQDLTDDLLKEIERWLSGHFVSLYEMAGKVGGGVIGSESIGGASISFVHYRLLAVGLLTTTYGQTACTLDISGTLLNLGKRKARVDTIEAVDIEQGDVIARVG